MRFILLILVLVGASSSGCRLSSHAANPEWVADFGKADTIMLNQKDRGQLLITDAETIKRLQTIYTKVKWEPYRITLPADVGDQIIELREGKTELRHFSYTGVLWESESYTEQRTAVLSDADSEWIESLFLLIPETAPEE